MTLALLGWPRIVRGGVDITRQIKYRKGIALLGYLAAHAGIWHSRETLADLLWPDFDLAAARTNLRQVLNNLNALLNSEAEVLQKDGAVVALVPDAGLRIDIALLSDATLDRIAADAPEARRWREREVEPWAAVLGEEFLAGLQLSDTPEFDEWLESTRVRFRARGALLLEHLCRAQRAEGRLPEAVGSARHLVRLAPLNESHNLLLMSLLAEAGDARGALDAFDAVRQRLETEMGVAPGGRLIALHRDILRRLDIQVARSPLRDPAVPELRQLTALYCASEALHDDESDDDFTECVHTVVQQRGGMVVSSVGRGLLAVFGLGDGSEGATQRAVLAALDLLPPTAGAAAHAPRIGISAGRVLMRPAARTPHLAGEVPDVAKLIGWTARPGEILASEAVALRTGERFRYEPAGEWNFLGLRGTHKLFRLTAETGSFPTENIPFSGRREELEQLSAYWEDACAGQPGIVLLRAPAGLGKTRLAGELAERVAARGGRVQRIQCCLEHQHRPLGAVLAKIRMCQHFARRSDCPAPDGDLDRAGSAGLLALMGEAQDADGERQPSKSAVFAALTEMLKAEAAQKPTLLVVDDLHWSDLATRELLALLARGLQGHKLLVILTTRPEVALDYPEGTTRIIDLAPLDEAASHSMIAAHDVGNVIPAAEKAEIAATCAGIPLFIECQVKSRLEGGHHRLSIAELLQGELDSFGGDKRVLHAAAVLGCRFERRHLAALLPDADVPGALARAVGRRLLRSESAETCSFRHALIRDAAYESLPPSRRKSLHERAARLLIEDRDPSPGEIAQHFSAAGCRDEAVEWWIKAGDGEMAQGFGADAMASFRQALHWLEAAGPAADRSSVSAVRMRLGYAAQVAEGFGSPLTYQLFVDMVAEMESSPSGYDPGQMFSALSGCYMGSSSFGKDDGLIIARRLQSLARTDAERLMARFALGNTLFWRGNFSQAADWQKQGIALAADVPFEDRIRYSVDDPAVTCRAFLAWTLWFAGDEAGACAMADEAVAVARKGKRTHALCFALSLGVGVHWCRGDVAKVAAWAGESLAVARQYGFPLWEGVSRLFALWAQARSGDMADRHGLFGAAALLQQAIPGRVTTSRWIVVHALLARDEWPEAEKLLDTALREVESQEEQYCLADLLWLKGKCLNRRGLAKEGREHCRRAVALAHEQGARGLLARFAVDGD